MNEWALVVFGGCITLSAVIIKLVPQRKGNSIMTKELCAAQRETTEVKLDNMSKDVTEVKEDIKRVEQTTTQILEAINDR